VAPMHVAETREKALENVRFGLGQWVRYFTEVIALPFEIKGSSIEDKCAQLIESGYAVIGDPDDAAAQLERLDKQSGGFGCFLQLAHNWADFPQTLRSYDLIARYVMPRFQGSNPGRQASLDWTAANREKFMNAGRQAKVLATEKHLAERRGKPSA
jgi:limonene 1,2-monooxygenase